MERWDPLTWHCIISSYYFYIFWNFFLPMFIVYRGFGLLDPFAVKGRYTSDCYIFLLSEEPFENVTHCSSQRQSWALWSSHQRISRLQRLTTEHHKANRGQATIRKTLA
ncbi:predicted coding region AF_0095 [Archaeoglobus fulgidus DSM 4304]|uniref:Uncharacterized protein AF_0095 n=1 Tax=Archaeoglobus fulgidus (strain ATCC 49558 / DSM 4304 / JCM 9628 / NBRC 100126 / VC-16) TaxID=224325 RepID=Y095_ARCFU|nr:RecName: Full=Uncharacterized protein AF_0095 [Archaeoglobus fulgidus DSM 4304]AAB91145.1 predicted coding region AF_0095 [Archaeoglobus fulgidus DSM 4304]